MTNYMHMKRNKVEMVSEYHSTCQYKLFPTIDHRYLVNDGYHEEDSFLDIDYQEAEAYYGNELDLAAPSCNKSAQHNDFNEYDKFSLENLREEIRHPAVIVWIRYSAQLVVRLTGKSSATGRVSIMRDHLKNEYPCKNERCPYRSVLGDEHNVYGGLGIITNEHVVQSDEEAMETNVEFFYHNNDRRDMVVKEKGRAVHVTDHNFDYTMFTCSAHRPELVNHIKMCTEIANFACDRIPENIKELLKKYAIVISHPHGTSKRVSIGKVVGFDRKGQSREANQIALALRDLYTICEKNHNSSKRFAFYFSLMKGTTLTVKVYCYDAATCQGSSGAPVYMGNTSVEDGTKVILPHTHRGRHPVNGHNNCYT